MLPLLIRQVQQIFLVDEDVKLPKDWTVQFQYHWTIVVGIEEASVPTNTKNFEITIKKNEEEIANLKIKRRPCSIEAIIHTKGCKTNY